MSNKDCKKTTVVRFSDRFLSRKTNKEILHCNICNMGDFLLVIFFGSFVLSLLLFLLYLFCLFSKMCALHRNVARMSAMHQFKLDSKTSLSERDDETDTTSVAVPHTTQFHQQKISHKGEWRLRDEESSQLRRDNSGFFRLPFDKRDSYYKFTAVDELKGLGEIHSGNSPNFLKPVVAGHRPLCAKRSLPSWENDVARILISSVGGRYIKECNSMGVTIPKIILNHDYDYNKVDLNLLESTASFSNNNKEVLI